MKKKLFIGTVLPTVAALAVIGSGFSLWIFSDSNHAEASGTISATVENVLTVGNLTATGTTKLVFDQKDTSLNAKAKDVHFEDENSKLVSEEGYAAQKVTYTFNSENKYGNESWQSDYEAGKSEVTFTTTITVPTSVANYITLTYAQTLTTTDNNETLSEGTVEGDNTVFTYTVLASNITNFNDNKAIGIDVFDWKNMSVSYKNEPKTLEAYKTMRTACDGKTISVAYSAVVTLK